jgi:hypothetical protein
MNLAIVSFYHQFTSPAMFEWHQKVFNGFNLPVNYIPTSGELSNYTHATAIDTFLRSTNADYVILFDIDCIPLHSGVVNSIVDIIRDQRTIFGVAQQSNHIIKPNGSFCHPYAAPACFGISRAVLETLNYPSFCPTDRGDTAEELTWLAEENRKKIKLKLWYPIRYQKPCGDWHVGPLPYGIGTTYGEEMVYHTFFSHQQSSVDLFVKKCESMGD